MIERLEAIEARYLELQDELVKPETFSDVKKMAELTKEQSSLKEAYKAYQNYTPPCWPWKSAQTRRPPQKSSPHWIRGSSR